ncbi:protein FAR1-RELATED SEQUENCE 5-like [Olea europaea var. sylvestris]|uniref:protein FAR1-RELATED SEQUENCE 5-like n=1 Tax=Olea europaea var. sylvestris TaxID=158386 RepID=UPI000C1D4293|nr:protein FAR1-RELATED SEQUENCE 5-like [Olea europaea var. sylvestris]
MDLDDKGRLKNVFWAENRCRQSYKEFGDIVTFDTTHMTNKYDMPFAPFVGVNHHGQSTLLGCGLLSNVDTGLSSGCSEHSLSICTVKLLLESLLIKIGRCKIPLRLFFRTRGIGWRSMLDMYELYDSDWLSGLYENRGRCVPYFLKTIFWAGTSTTQRSESMNAFFDGYVHSKTSLKQFVEQYERALKNKVEKEFQADFKSYSQMVPCATTFLMEKQFQAVYTISKFKEVQEEFTRKVYCDVVSENASDYYWSSYVVREEIIVHEQPKKKSF